MRLAACALIVLPLVPDKGLGQHGAVNPSTVRRLVVIVMAVRVAGYVALRAIGPRHGLLVAGLVSGGFVSAPPPSRRWRRAPFANRDCTAPPQRPASSPPWPRSCAECGCGRTGVMLGTATAGCSDSQSPAISSATVAEAGRISTFSAGLAILAALSANTATKAMVAGALGDRRYALGVWPKLARILASAWGRGAITGGRREALYRPSAERRWLGP